MKKLLCLLMAILLVAALFPVNAFAAETEESLDSYLTAELDTYLMSYFAQCEPSIPLTQFQIPEEYDDAFADYVQNELPEAFNVYYAYTSSMDGEIIEKLGIWYEDFADTPEEFNTLNDRMMAGAEELLKGVEGNSLLTDVEKALILHDRLASWTAYGYVEPDLNKAHCAYGPLADQKGVCQGYTMAYMYLLKRVGIESDYCRSGQLTHAWNIVYIDGVPYHVDVTWDDPTPDHLGKVRHNNFLRSTAGIIATGHEADDFITTPADTTYDNYYWQKADTPFALIGSELYFIDSYVDQLCHIDGTTITQLLSVADYWPSPDGFSWVSMACLSVVEDVLLYSLSDAIYAYDPATGANYKVFEPDLSGDENLSVRGFKYEKGNLNYELWAGEWGTEEQISVPFELPAPINGWKQENGKWYYYQNNVKQTGWIRSGGVWYYMNASGVMQTGWIRSDGAWYYLNGSGAMQTGWLRQGGTWYYLNSSGAMQTGWVKQGGVWYYLKSSGAMATGWVHDGGIWYYMNSSGAMVTGWLKLGNTWYYFRSSGAMATGSVKIGNKTYNFNSSGACLNP